MSTTTTRYRISWTTSHDVLVDVGSPEERATSTCHCSIEQWSNEDECWIAPEDERVASACDGLIEGDDWTSPAPFVEARARLLAKAGLGEDDLTDPDDEDW